MSSETEKGNIDMEYTVTYPDVHPGESGELITQLQDLLVKSGSSITMTGVFDLGTRNAVRAFQKKYHLTVDTIVGPETWTKLLETAGNIKITEPKKAVKVSVTIPGLTEKEAAGLLKKYPKATING